MKSDNQQDINIASIQTDIKWLMKELENIKSNHLTSIYNKLTCLERKVNSRPTWILSLVISSLLALVVGLIVFILTGK